MVKNEHYIPQFYLKRFGNNGKIDAYDIQKQKYILNTNVVNLASQRFFYDIEPNKLKNHNDFLKRAFNITNEELTSDIQYVEKILSNIENKMSTYLEQFEHDYTLINNEDFLSSLFLFIRTLSIRTVGYRETLSNITTQTSQWLKSLNIEKCANFPLEIPPEELAKIQQLEYIVSLPDTYKKSILFFNNYNIFIGINNTELGFLISNEPYIGFELGFNDICFPINRFISIIMQVKNVDNNFLICTKKPNRDNIVNLDIRDVEKYNMLQNHLKSKFLFGNQKDIQHMLALTSYLKHLSSN